MKPFTLEWVDWANKRGLMIDHILKQFSNKEQQYELSATRHQRC